MLQCEYKIGQILIQINNFYPCAGDASSQDFVDIPDGFDDVMCVDFEVSDNQLLDDGNTIYVNIIASSPGISVSSDSKATVRVTDDESKMIPAVHLRLYSTIEGVLNTVSFLRVLILAIVQSSN